MKLSRQYFRPLGWIVVEIDEALGLEIYRQPGRLVAMGFAGKRSRPDFHYSFRTEEQLTARCETFAKGIRDAVSAKAERLAKERAELTAHDVEIGDIFRMSWGYEQTNIDYYEVIALSGCMATVREIGGQSVETESMQGSSVPLPGAFLANAEPIRKRIQMCNGKPYLAMKSYASAYRMEPVIVGGLKCFEVSHWTAYA